MKDSNQEPIKSKCQQIPFHLKEKTKAAIEEQIEAGIIKQTNTEWASPTRIVKKPNGTVRITVNYKTLNKYIKGDSYPIPNIQEAFIKMANAKIMSKIDPKSAYHQIAVDKDSIDKTGFICEFGLFTYQSMPMGIKTAASFFQRYMNEAFKSMINKNCVSVYMDDIVVYSDSVEQQVFHSLL